MTIPNSEKTFINNLITDSNGVRYSWTGAAEQAATVTYNANLKNWAYTSNDGITGRCPSPSGWVSS